MFTFIFTIQPSFPVDEKRRIMEIFKERKKNRRKKVGKKVASTMASSDVTSIWNSNAVNGSASSSVCSGVSSIENILAATNSNSAGTEGLTSGGHENSHSSSVSNIGCPAETNGITKMNDVSNIGCPAESNVIAKMNDENGHITSKALDDLRTSDDVLINDFASISTKKKKKKKKMKRQLSVDSVASNSSSSPMEDMHNGKSDTNDMKSAETPLKEKSKQGMGKSLEEEKKTSLSPPPPGFNASMSSLALGDDISQNDQSQEISPCNHQPLTKLPGKFQNPEQGESIPPGSRFIVIPEQDRPIKPPGQVSLSCPPKVSLAVAAAKVFVDLYYQHPPDLAMYYTSHAQKSISVGGAHSVVATRSEILLQLQSLAHSTFAVRGVVSQDSFDLRGAHILVTGVVQTGGVLTQFAHTIGLVPVPQHGPYSFQIHNDALSLLTNGDEVAQNCGTKTFDVPHHQERHGAPNRHSPGIGL